MEESWAVLVFFFCSTKTSQSLIFHDVILILCCQLILYLPRIGKVLPAHPSPWKRPVLFLSFSIFFVASVFLLKPNTLFTLKAPSLFDSIFADPITVFFSIHFFVYQKLFLKDRGEKRC